MIVGNEISVKRLNSNAEGYVLKIHQVMTLKEYGVGSIKSYVNEMILLFKYYNHKDVEQITQEDIEQYMLGDGDIKIPEDFSHKIFSHHHDYPV